MYSIISLTVVIILLCIHVSKPHITQLEYIQFFKLYLKKAEKILNAKKLNDFLNDFQQCVYNGYSLSSWVALKIGS